MTVDRTEALIRDALAAEAGRAVNAQIVLDELRRAGHRPPHRRGPLIVVAAVVVVVAVAAVLVPRLVRPTPQLAAASSPPVSQNVLLAGLDANGWADSIALFHGGENGTGVLVSLPRDTWVDVPGLGQRKLTAAYHEGGIDKLVAAVEALTGAHVDHYATIDMSGFARLSTAIGGVPVCLNAATHDPLSGASFPAGRQTVAGDSALAFLRQRHGLPNNELDRVARLQAFLVSLAHKMAGRLGDPQVVNTLLTQVRDEVHVDPGWDLVTFAGQLHSLRPDQIRGATIPIMGDVQTPSGTALGVDVAKVQSSVTAVIADPQSVGKAPDADGVFCVN